MTTLRPTAAVRTLVSLAVLLLSGQLAAALTLWVDTIPPHAWGAPGGGGFYQRVKNLSQTQREQEIYLEVSGGNVPGFARNFVPISVQETIGGQVHHATFWVMPDYLPLGWPKSFFRLPLTPGTAQALLDQFQCLLPTRKMVDAIWAAAPIKLAPYPLSPAQYDITDVSTMWLHHQIIEWQRLGKPLGPLVAGTKKDVVITPLLASYPGRVAIYGWHQLNGQPIQPLYLGHGDYYVDYSHGIRPVWGEMVVDGSWMSVESVLADPVLNVLLSDEGVITNPRY